MVFFLIQIYLPRIFHSFQCFCGYFMITFCDHYTSEIASYMYSQKSIGRWCESFLKNCIRSDYHHRNFIHMQKCIHFIDIGFDITLCLHYLNPVLISVFHKSYLLQSSGSFSRSSYSQNNHFKRRPHFSGKIVFFFYILYTIKKLLAKEKKTTPDISCVCLPKFVKILFALDFVIPDSMLGNVSIAPFIQCKSEFYFSSAFCSWQYPPVT